MSVRFAVNPITTARDNQVAMPRSRRYPRFMAGPKSEAAKERERRLQAALRENLKRRKAQARRRAEQEPAEPHDSAGIIPDKDKG